MNITKKNFWENSVQLDDYLISALIIFLKKEGFKSLTKDIDRCVVIVLYLQECHSNGI